MFTTEPQDLSIRAAAQGLLAQNFDRADASSSTGLVSQRVYYLPVVLRAGQTVTNVHVQVTTAASGASTVTAKVGLYNKAGTRLEASANLTTAWESTGTKTHALASPYAVTISDLYFVALLYDGSSSPQMLRIGAAAATGLAVIGSGVLPYAAVSTQTDLDASESLAATSALNLWVGVS